MAETVWTSGSFWSAERLSQQGTVRQAADDKSAVWVSQRNRIYGLGPTLIAKRLCAEKVLTPELVQFIEKIVVSEARYLDNKRVQVVDIYYKGVGMIRGFSPEELEEIFQEGEENHSESKSPARQERRVG